MKNSETFKLLRQFPGVYYFHNSCGWDTSWNAALLGKPQDVNVAFLSRSCNELALDVRGNKIRAEIYVHSGRTAQTSAGHLEVKSESVWKAYDQRFDWTRNPRIAEAMFGQSYGDLIYAVFVVRTYYDGPLQDSVDEGLAQIEIYRAPGNKNIRPLVETAMRLVSQAQV